MTCAECKEEAVAERSRCERHLAKAREAQRRHREAHAEELRRRNNARYRDDEEYRERQKTTSNRARKHDPLLNRKYHLWTRFGMTLGDWETLYLFQGQRCALCFGDKPGGKGTLHTDHDHQTDVVRGLLCHWCNTSLERAEIDGWLARAASYLKLEFA